MGISDVATLVKALDWQPEDMRRARQTHDRLALFLAVTSIGTLAVVLGEEVANVLKAKQTGEWFNAVGLAFAAQVAVQILMVACMNAQFRYAPQIRQPQVEAALSVLRAAAAQSDDNVAPRATKVIEGLSQAHTPELPLQIRRLQHPRSHIGYTNMVALYVPLYLGIVMVLGAIGVLVFYGSKTGYLWVGIMIGGILCTAIGGILLIWAGRRRRGITVTADTFGLQWVPPGRGHRVRSMAWNQARAFYLVSYLDGDYKN